MKKRIFVCLLAFAIGLTALCSGCGKKERLTNPPGHGDLTAVIGTTIPEAVKLLGVSESDLVRDEYLIDVFHTGRTVEFAGMEFDICLGMFIEEEVVNSLYYLKVYDGNFTDFPNDVLNVAKELEKNVTKETAYNRSDSVLAKNYSLAELEKGFFKPEGNTLNDVFDITEEAPKNVRDHMEFMMTTDFWKNFGYLNENIPIPAGYLCEFIASCVPDNNRASMFIRYYVNRRPGHYSYMVVED